MRTSHLLLLATFLAVQPVYSQDRVTRSIPDIPGYITLICDFHLHTVFSDGTVWPTERVNEAWMEGIDAIAITDHLEYMPHKEDIRTDHNKAWEIARDYAKDKGVIVIPGTEITKQMPPGHFNAIFIDDATPINNSDYKKAIGEAASQGAFIMWNHPGWKPQQPDTMKWWDEHTLLYEKGWLQGIEIVNSNEFYPGAISWALDKNLTIFGNSDQHGPFRYGPESPKHRSSTLVFAKEATEEGIREALFNQRSAAYFEDKIIGKKEWLLPLAKNGLSTSGTEQPNMYLVSNNTEFSYELSLLNKNDYGYRKNITVEPGHESVVLLAKDASMNDIQIVVNNFITGYNESLEFPLSELIDQ